MNKKLRREEINVFGMEISDGSHVFLDSKWHCDGTCDPFTRLYFVKSGRGYLRCNGKEITLEGGKAYLIPSGCSFSYGCESLEKIFFHISFTTMEKYDLLSSTGAICSIPFSKEEYSELLAFFTSDDYFDLLRLKTVLYKTVLSFCEKYKFSKAIIKEYSELTKKVMSYIQHNARINLSVPEISRLFFVSESKIRNKFKEEVGVNIGLYIDDMVFFKAKKLLSKKALRIKDISDELGFCDQFYFSRRFKEKYGITPTEYKKEICTSG